MSDHSSDSGPADVTARPAIPVQFHYFEGGRATRSVVAVCPAVPRVGEFVLPERGSPAVVHAVFWQARTDPGGPPAMVPLVAVRGPTADEAERMRLLLAAG